MTGDKAPGGEPKPSLNMDLENRCIRSIRQIDIFMESIEDDVLGTANVRFKKYLLEQLKLIKNILKGE